jgi:hypothetical protein
MMDFPEVSEQISSNQEQLLGLFDYPSSVGFPNPQNVTAFGQQVQDTIITDPNTRVGGVALQNEWFSSGSSMQLPKNVGSAESVLKVSGHNNVLLIPWPNYFLIPSSPLFCFLLPVLP